MRQRDRQYYLAHKESHNEKSRLYSEQNRDKICAQKKGYYQQNKEKFQKYNAEHKLKRNLNKSARRTSDPMFRVVESLKARLHYVLKGIKTERSSVYIGCGTNHLQEWLESQFNQNMSWDNYGVYWHIDHVIPIDAFNMENPIARMVCFHWSNLRPLEKHHNMRKSSHVIYQDVKEHENILKTYIDSHGYQTLPEKAWWLREELRYGNNPEDDFTRWLVNEMGNPQPSSLARQDKEYGEGSTIIR